jgi:hypothetical protein
MKIQGGKYRIYSNTKHPQIKIGINCLAVVKIINTIHFYLLQEMEKY